MPTADRSCRIRPQGASDAFREMRLDINQVIENRTPRKHGAEVLIRVCLSGVLQKQVLRQGFHVRSYLGR